MTHNVDGFSLDFVVTSSDTQPLERYGESLNWLTNIKHQYVHSLAVRFATLVWHSLGWRKPSPPISFVDSSRTLSEHGVRGQAFANVV